VRRTSSVGRRGRYAGLHTRALPCQTGRVPGAMRVHAAIRRDPTSVDAFYNRAMSTSPSAIWVRQHPISARSWKYTRTSLKAISAGLASRGHERARSGYCRLHKAIEIDPRCAQALLPPESRLLHEGRLRQSVGTTCERFRTSARKSLPDSSTRSVPRQEATDIAARGAKSVRRRNDRG